MNDRDRELWMELRRLLLAMVAAIERYCDVPREKTKGKDY